MATIRLIPSTYQLSNTQYLAINNANNMYANTDSTSYGTITHNRASTSNIYYVYIRGFNIGDVPSNVTINSFTVKIKASAVGHTTSTSSSYYMSLINGTTQIGNTNASGRLTTATTTFTFANGSLSWNQIVGYGSNFGIRIPLRRASQNTADVVSVYGAEILVDYESKVFVKDNSLFLESNFYKKTNGTWSLINYNSIYSKVSGAWLTGQTTSMVSGFVTRTYALNNCVVNLDGINSYANRYIDSSTDEYVYPIDHTSTFMRGYDIIGDGQSFIFNGTTSYMRPGASASFDNYLYTGYTIEVFFELSSFDLTDGNAFLLYVGRNSTRTIALYCYYYNGTFSFIKSSATESKMLVLSSLSLNEKHYIAANADGWMFDGVYYPDSETTAESNSVATNDVIMVSGQYACASIGMRFKTDRNPDAFNGKLYALRIHSTKLTENEMRKNMSCDFSRFS